jgi:parvulin-like peptidyl-prolyl isomerase
MQQKTLLVIIIMVLIIGAGGWFFFSKGGFSTQKYTQELSGAVARVNGEDITREELEISETQFATQQGVDVASLDATGRKQLQTQVLDVLISNILIRQAVADSGITATEADIDTQIQAVRGQFPDDAQFQEALLAQGVSESDLRLQITEVLIQQIYLEQKLNLTSITASTEEVEALYEQEATASEDEIPPLEEVRGQIESFVIQQKQQELLVAHIQELRSSADIEILI